MTNKKFRKLLEKFPDDLEITITDGYKANCYHGNFKAKIFKQFNGVKTIDIGIGGFIIHEEIENKNVK